MSAILKSEDDLMPAGPIEGPAAWYGPAMDESRAWMRPFTEAELAELDAAMRGILRRGLPIVDIRKQDFPLPTLGPKLEDIRRELLDGCGFVLFRGIPVERYTVEESAIVYYGLGMHFGVSLTQNAKGHVLGHVKDLGYDHEDPNVRIYQTTVRQTYHTDSCDFVGLLCLQPAKEGGLSSIVSSVTIFNEMLRRRPDLAEVLLQPIETDRRGEVPAGKKGYYRMPVFNWYAGKLSTLYARRYIESARRFDEVPPLTAAQQEALDMFDALANDPALKLDMEFKPGDVQLLHNHQILHDRTAYVDWPEPERKRHLLRLWISAPDGRPLPEIYAERYGSVEIGSRDRGGIHTPGRVFTAPLEAE
jgi:hypothetical protein